MLVHLFFLRPHDHVRSTYLELGLRYFYMRHCNETSIKCSLRFIRGCVYRSCDAVDSIAYYLIVIDAIAIAGTTEKWRCCRRILNLVHEMLSPSNSFNEWLMGCKLQIVWRQNGDKIVPTLELLWAFWYAKWCTEWYPITNKSEVTRRKFKIHPEGTQFSTAKSES